MADGYTTGILAVTYDYEVGMTLQAFTEELARLVFEGMGQGYEVRLGGQVTVELTPRTDCGGGSPEGRG